MFEGECWNSYSVYGSYCLLKHSYIAPFLPLVFLSDLLSILQHRLSTGYEPRLRSIVNSPNLKTRNALRSGTRRWHENSSFES